MNLIINGHIMELSDADNIKYSIQANTIGDLTNRQSNFTPSFKLPKTPHNVQAMENLSLVGSGSNVPYQQNETSLLDDSGNSLITDGWAVLKETKSYYSCYVYDGYVSFYKAIENIALTEIGLSELNHLKNLASVIETWTDETKPYRYNVADYNGKMLYDTNKLNLDYLIPSAKVSYLWDKIFEYVGWTYSGSVFDLEDFKTRWLTYPKTIGEDTQQTIGVHVWNFHDMVGYQAENTFLGAYQYSPHMTHTPVAENAYITSQDGTNGRPDGGFITIQQDGLYKFTFNGSIGMSSNSTYQDNFNIICQNPEYEEIFKFENAGDFSDVEDVFFYVQLSAGDVFQLNLSPLLNDYGFMGSANRVVGEMDITLELYEGNFVDFEEALIDFSVTDFVKEVMVDFALTPFVNARNKSIEFLTIDEIIQNEETDNWSEKYQSKDSETYIVGSYAQENNFAYKYNEDEDNHNDSKITVNNKNLDDNIDYYTSKTYSPEKNKTNILGRDVNVYKFWNKEVDDDGEVKYKALEKRFYFIKSILVESTITVGSEYNQASQEVSFFMSESFSGLRWVDKLSNYYGSVNAIINKSKLFKVSINLNSLDISKIDLSKPVYIAQEAAYFLKNKISNWKRKSVNTTVELIKLDLSVVNDNIVYLEPRIVITSNIQTDLYHEIITQFNFIDYQSLGANITIDHYSDLPEDGGVDDGQYNYTAAVNVSAGQHILQFGLASPIPYGWYRVQVVDNDGTESNVEWVYFGDTSDTDPNDNVSPNIEVIPETLGQNYYGVPHSRDISYRFNNFTPTSASMTIQAYNYLNSEVEGVVNTVTITNLSADTLHTLTDVDFPSGFGFFKIILTTNTISFNQVILLY